MKAPKRTLWTGLVLWLTLTMLLLASCGGGAATTTTSTTSPSTTVTTQTSSPSPLPDGEHFGFLRAASNGTLEFDPADFLTGDAALAAAREEGIIGQDEDLPNDFYISNPETDTVELTVGDSAVFTLIGLDQADALVERPVLVDELKSLWSGSADSSRLYGFVPGDLPMTVTLSDGLVVSAAQEYLP